MYKYYKFVIVIGLACFILTYGALTVEPDKDSDFIKVANKAVATILEECNLNIKHVIVYNKGSDSSTFNALATLQPFITVTLITNTEVIPLRRNILHRFGYQAFVAVTDMRDGFNDTDFDPVMTWNHDHNFMIIIIPNPAVDCSDTQLLLFFELVFLYIFPIYFICLEDNEVPKIHTFDPYGNTFPPYWEQWAKTRYRYNKASLYRRNIDENICRGFSFNRADQNGLILCAGVFQAHRYNYNHLVNEYYMEHLLHIIHHHVVQQDETKSFDYLLNEDDTDVVLQLHSAIGKKEDNILSFPIYVDDQYKIISHKRGLSTPLEKICDFYGIWTLSSLIILLIITFLTIWLVARKKMSFAAFEVLRLLINNGLHVPMQNTSLRIFFLVIFLYFIVIQATFSGNLAKFLTIPQYRRNIETIADLTDPRIEIIYNFYSPLRLHDDKAILQKKERSISYGYQCVEEVVKHQTAACIANSVSLKQSLFTDDVNNTLYLSKKSLGEPVVGFLYRNRFPYRERYDWTIMYLNERKLFFHEVYMDIRFIDYIQLIREKNSEVNFRKISLEDIKFAFILLGFGYFLGLLSFIIEVLIGRCNFSKLRRKSMKTQSIKINVIPSDSPIE